MGTQGTELTDEQVEQIEDYLEQIDCRPKRGGYYFSCLCPHPDHDDRTPSCQVYFNDGFVHCHTCNWERNLHINEIAKLRGDPPVIKTKYNSRKKEESVAEEKPKRKERELPLGDFTSMWLDLSPLPNDFNLKGVPAIELNKRGWRAMPAHGKEFGAIYIPYFDVNRSVVHYYQIRYLEGETRFTVAPGVRQIAYGLEMLPRCKKYLCFTEGSRDSVILGMAGVPAVAMISASANQTLAGMIKYAKANNLEPIAVCDNDDAGDKLLNDLPGYVLDYRVSKLDGKDIGDLYEKKGLDAVRQMYKMFIEE